MYFSYKKYRDLLFGKQLGCKLKIVFNSLAYFQGSQHHSQAKNAMLSESDVQKSVLPCGQYSALEIPAVKAE